MTQDKRNNGSHITRLVVSGGKKVEPRLMMAHPMGEPIVEPTSRRRQWLAIAIAILAVITIVTIALVGQSW